MTELHFTNLLIVVAVAFAAPLLVALAPWLRVPAVVLEIVLGIVIGPAGLGWVEADEPVRVVALLGLGWLLFLAGLEIDVHELRGRPLRLAGLGFLA
jgi:Kef-type K+ transport system membrane component KefB